MKVAILGYSGSGKSTLTKYISEYYNIPKLYLDTVQFEENWGERDRDTAVAMVKEFMDNDQWVIDGNYTGFMQEERLAQADYIIYMEFSRLSCLYRAFKRYITNKNTSRESMANGCIEKIDIPFIWWILYKGRTADKKKKYDDILKKYEEKAIVIKNQKELDEFMVKLFK